MERFVLKEIKNFVLELRNNESEMLIYDIPIHNISQMQIIEYVMSNSDKDVNQKDLEIALNLKKPTISGILDTMEKKNIIVRMNDKSDGRKKVIKLTKEFRDVHIHIMERICELNNCLVRNIPKDKLDVFFEVLFMIKDNLKEVNKNDKIV